MPSRNTTIAAAIISSLFLASSAQAAGSIRNEPLVIYDVSGYGIVGERHQHLTVYSSGLCSMSRQDLTTEEAFFQVVPASRARALAATLIDNGAMSQGDLPERGADLPLHTVTVFRSPRPGAAHNTFSYYDPTDPAAAMVEALIAGFVFEAFGDSKTLGVESTSKVPLRAWRRVLDYGETKSIDEANMEIEFRDVPSDSRCPEDVACLWAGEVEVVLNIRLYGVDHGEFHLTYGADGSTSTEAGGYEIRMLGARPAARSDPPIRMEEYKILIQINEL